MTIVITSLAIVATASIYGLRGQLSLHHAVVVEALLKLVMLPMHLVEPWRVRSPVLFFAQQIRFGAYIALSLWLSIKTPCLGSDPQCNMCTRRTAFFFFTGHANNYMNRSWSILTLVFICTNWAQSQWWTYGPGNYMLTIPALLSEMKARSWISHVRMTQRTLFNWRQTQVKMNPAVWLSFPRFNLWYENDCTVSAQLKAKRWMQAPGLHTNNSGWLHRAWSDSKLAIRVPRVQRAIIGMILVTLWTIATEQTVKMNVSPKANEWGFGQIASIILGVPAVASSIKLVLRLGRNVRLVFCISITVYVSSDGFLM